MYDYKGRKNICGIEVRRLRVLKRLSQGDLAARVQVAGVTMERDSISRIERGTRFVADYELYIFAKVLGTDMGALLGIEEKEE